jgi:hypothetical protein
MKEPLLHSLYPHDFSPQMPMQKFLEATTMILAKIAAENPMNYCFSNFS